MFYDRSLCVGFSLVVAQMNLWKPGRSSPFNYFKFQLASIWFFDCYILKFPKGSSIDWHTDPLPNDVAVRKHHHRLNFFLKKPKEGGQILTKEFMLDGERRGASYLIFRHKTRLHYMRPDKTIHAVSEVKSGTGYILSIGWLTDKR